MMWTIGALPVWFELGSSGVSVVYGKRTFYLRLYTQTKMLNQIEIANNASKFAFNRGKWLNIL